MKREGIGLALAFLLTISMFSGCISQIEDENGVDITDPTDPTGTKDPKEPEETVSYLKAKINISQPYNISDMNSSRQKVEVIRDSGIRMEAIVTLYRKSYEIDDTVKVPIVETEEDAIKILESLPDEALLYLQGYELDEDLWGTETVHWNSHMRNLAFAFAKEGANYNLYETMIIVMNEQRKNVTIDESQYLREGYENWWIQDATNTFYSGKALGQGPYVTLYASLMRSIMVPTKIVYGLYYDLEKGGVWRPYAWNEVYFNGEWIPIDPYRGIIGNLSRNYLALYETVDLLDLQDDFACYRSHYEGRGCKPFEVEIIETGTVLKSELNN